MRRAAVAALAAGCFLSFAQPGLFAGDQAAGDKIPEPAHQFAKEASSRVTETEREWVKMIERLTKSQADFTVADRASTDGSLRDEASRLLASAKKLLADQKQMGTDLERFKDALKKAASHYREVAALYKAHAAEARSAEVKADYLVLEGAYVRKAGAAAERCEKVTMPAGAKAKAEVIEEGNLFLERLCEALAIGPVNEAERGVFVERLKKHGERCKALADELRQGAEKLLQDSDAPEIRQKIGGVSKLPSAAAWLLETPGGKKDFSLIRGASWSCPVTVSGVQCVQVIRFAYAGSCSQSVYLPGPKGKGKLVGTGSATFILDVEGGLSFYQAGMLVERRQVTLLGKDQWSYEILENRVAPGLAGTRLTFTREP